MNSTWEGPGTPRLFLSYSSQDTEDVTRLAERLTVDKRLRAWLAPEQIAPGENYAAKILEAISMADAFMVLISAASIKSDHVKREVSLSLERSLRIIPIIKESVLLDRLPPEWKYWLSTIQVHRWTSADVAAKMLSELLTEKHAPPLRRFSNTTARPGSHGINETLTRQMRSIVIQIARTSGNLEHTLRRCRRLECTDAQVLSLVNDLRDSGLIHFSDPLMPETMIKLNG